MNLTFSNPAVDETVYGAVRRAIETHRRLGQSIVVMRDGKVTWIAPEDIAPLDQSSRAPVSRGEEEAA